MRCRVCGADSNNEKSFCGCLTPDNKPREFWLEKWSTGYMCHQAQSAKNAYIHVIEHFAYIDLKIKYEKSIVALNKIMESVGHTPMCNEKDDCYAGCDGQRIAQTILSELGE